MQWKCAAAKSLMMTNRRKAEMQFYTLGSIAFELYMPREWYNTYIPIREATVMRDIYILFKSGFINLKDYYVHYYFTDKTCIFFYCFVSYLTMDDSRFYMIWKLFFFLHMSDICTIFPVYHSKTFFFYRMILVDCKHFVYSADSLSIND